MKEGSRGPHVVLQVAKGKRQTKISRKQRGLGGVERDLLGFSRRVALLAAGEPKERERDLVRFGDIYSRGRGLGDLTG